MKVFMLVYSLQPDSGGGVNRAVLNRASDLANNGYDVSILTLKDYNVEGTRNKLKKMKRLNKRVKLLNIYEDYRLKADGKVIAKKVKKEYEKNAKLKEPKYKCEFDSKNNTASYFYKGNFIKLKKWRKNKSLQYIDFFNENQKRELRKIYHKDGYLEKKIYFNPENEKRNYIQYFTKSGQMFLNKKILDKIKDNEYTLYTSIKTSKNNSFLNRFRRKQQSNFMKSDNEFFTNWLNNISLEQEDKPIIICDKATCVPSVLNMKQDIAYRIYTIHSNHIRVNRTKNYVKYLHKLIFNNLHEIDHLVVLTEKQKSDILEYYTDYKNITVIPHNIQPTNIKKVNKDLNSIALVARLAPEKQVSEAIEAFQIVVNQVPNAKLNIFGTGRLKENLQKSIKDLKLENNVFLRGYVTDTDLVYQSSLASILTSRSEGLSMVVLESMNNGTPVISYDIDYGPSDIITNNVDGYLIEEDKQQLADKIVELLNNPEKAQEMGKKAKENVVNNFSEEKTMEKWMDVINHLTSKS